MGVYDKMFIVNQAISFVIESFRNREDETSLSEIVKIIQSLYVEAKKGKKMNEKKIQEYIELKASLNRLNTQIEKQNLFNKKLKNEINKIDKTKKEYEDELKDTLNKNRIITSKINYQFEEIQRLLAEKDDKSEFIDQQIKNTNGNFTNKTTTLLSKRMESENEDKYYKSLCKTLMIEDILSNNINIAKSIKLTEDNVILSEKYHRSKKDLKSALDSAELCKYNYGSYIDETYDRIDKTEILKMIIQTFNHLITNGYMCYWKSMIKVLKKNAVLWTTPTHKPSGTYFKFNFPFEDCSISSSLTFTMLQYQSGVHLLLRRVAD
ncbi:uncharacterized protein PF07_0086-like [Melanaphis sacchari]|uniref:uncharacterized protein PF07_0086-like n=1 Tax=Melanaphis sacchari TaxID=742174 RepID=UPI000DC1324C|nr:uncharacterized protein PF07_0086-like [Melanaphis sacchari]